MKTFKQHLLNEVTVPLPRGIFVKATPTTESVLKLKHYFAELECLGQNLLPDLHCTVIYSKENNNAVDLPVIDKNDKYRVYGTQIEYWPGHDNEGYIVMKLHSPDLQELHQRFRMRGIEPTFKDYKPHVSLLHPVTMPDLYRTMIQNYNYRMQTRPPMFDLFYGGYTIQESTIDP